ncbi:early lactation protein-like isoform X2 [Pseudorca crassidens]
MKSPSKASGTASSPGEEDPFSFSCRYKFPPPSLSPEQVATHTMKLSRLLALCLTLCLVGLASSGKTSANLQQEASQELLQTPPALCQLPAVRGPCKASLHRYFYNSTSIECEPFTYGGCQGNANNFETTEICVRVCKPPETKVKSS